MSDKVNFEKFKQVITHLGGFHWYTSNKTGSVYYRFKDSRLGSIRIADHDSRKRYNYKYDLRTPLDNLLLSQVMNDLYYKAKSLNNPKFISSQYVVYDPEVKLYVVKNFKSEQEFRHWFRDLKSSKG